MTSCFIICFKKYKVKGNLLEKNFNIFYGISIKYMKWIMWCLLFLYEKKKRTENIENNEEDERYMRKER